MEGDRIYRHCSCIQVRVGPTYVRITAVSKLFWRHWFFGLETLRFTFCHNQVLKCLATEISKLRIHWLIICFTICRLAWTTCQWLPRGHALFLYHCSLHHTGQIYNRSSNCVAMMIALTVPLKFSVLGHYLISSLSLLQASIMKTLFQQQKNPWSSSISIHNFF